MLERLFMLSWYGHFQWTWILFPISCLFYCVTRLKRTRFLKAQKIKTKVPVVVIGNITVGGTGKTPLVQALVEHLKEKGYKPGVISRGYGASIQNFPHLISLEDRCELVGDEPYMLAHSLNVPVVIDPKRKQALERVMELGVDVVLSDDGMQHYDLPRDIEICVLDGVRMLGNEQLLPVGPLREPKSRLNEVDMVALSGVKGGGNKFDFSPVGWVNVKSGVHVPVSELNIEKDALAIAGIGNPLKFSKSLEKIGIIRPLKAFADHYAYESSDFIEIPGQVLMTQKDAVKIQPFSRENMWYLKIQAGLSDEFFAEFMNKLENCLER